MLVNMLQTRQLTLLALFVIYFVSSMVFVDTGRVSALENYKYYFSALIASLSLAATWVWNKVNFK